MHTGNAPYTSGAERLSEENQYWAPKYNAIIGNNNDIRLNVLLKIAYFNTLKNNLYAPKPPILQGQTWYHSINFQEPERVLHTV